eukprot:scaffold1109_cov70-Cylindrotheca_fusiformis.AAC.1
MSSWDSGLNYSQCQVRIVKGLKPGEGGWNFLKFAMTAKRDDRSSLATIVVAQKCEMPSRTGPDDPHPNTDLVATPQSVIFRLTPVFPVMLALSGSMVEWTRSSRVRWGLTLHPFTSCPYRFDSNLQ